MEDIDKGITIVNDERKYEQLKITPGVRVGTLRSITTGQRKKYQSEEIEPIFISKWAVNDDNGEIKELNRRTTKTISMGKMKSNLYKDLKAMVPEEGDGIYMDKALVSALIDELNQKATIGKIKCLLQLEKSENGFIAIRAVLPMPKGNKPQAAVPNTITDDDIPF